jgi:hypothetical protein
MGVEGAMRPAEDAASAAGGASAAETAGGEGTAGGGAGGDVAGVSARAPLDEARRVKSSAAAPQRRSVRIGSWGLEGAVRR